MIDRLLNQIFFCLNVGKGIRHRRFNYEFSCRQSW